MMLDALQEKRVLIRMQKSVENYPFISEYVEQDVLEAMQTLFSAGTAADQSAAAAVLAQALGADDSVKKILASDESSEQEAKLLSSFQNNLKLLVQKTWVEKSDEALKEQVLYRLDTICKTAGADVYTQSYAEIVKLLNDALFLMFGSQAQKEDFIKYAFRIDPGFGIFSWYVNTLPPAADDAVTPAKIMLLPGIFFLSTF